MGRPHGLGPASGSRLLLTRTTALPTSRRPGTPGVLMTGRGGAGARAEGVRVFTPAGLGQGPGHPGRRCCSRALGAQRSAGWGPGLELWAVHMDRTGVLCV